MPDQTVTILGLLQDKISAPLNKITAGLTHFAERAKHLGETIAPTFAKLGILIEGAAIVEGAKKAIEAAGEEVQAEKRLEAALRGRRIAQEDILKSIEEIEAHSLFKREDLVGFASLLKDAGFEAKQIPEVLQAAADTAAGLQKPLDGIVRGLAQIGRGGKGAALTRQLPDLKPFIKDGATAIEIVQRLQEEFSGRAQETTNTTFGQIELSEKRIEEFGKTAGVVLARIKLALLQALEPVVEAIVKVVQSKGFGDFVKVFERAAPVIVPVAIALAGVATALITIGTVAAVLAPVASGLASVATFAIGLVEALGAIGVAAGGTGAALAGVLVVATALGVAIGVAFLKITGQLDDAVAGAKQLGTVFAGSLKDFTEITKKVIDGKLGIADLVDFAKTKFLEYARVFEAFFVAPFEIFFSAASDTVGGFFDFVKGAGVGAVLRIANSAQGQVLSVVRFATRQVDSLLNEIDAALAKVDKSLGTSLAPGQVNFEALVPKDLIDLQPSIDEADAQVKDGFAKLTTSFSNAAVRLSAGIANAFIKNVNEADALLERMKDSQDRRARDIADRIEEEITLEKKKSDRLVSDAESLRIRIADVLAVHQAVIDLDTLVNLDPSAISAKLARVDESVRATVSDVLGRELDRSLQRQEIAVDKFLELRRAITVGSSESELASQTSLADAQSEVIKRLEEERAAVRNLIKEQEDQSKALAGQEGVGEALKALAEDRRDLAEQEVELSGEIADATRTLLTAEEDRGALVAKIADGEEKIRGVRKELAADILKDLDRQVKALDDAGAAATTLVQSGAIGQSDAIAHVSKSVTELEDAAFIARERITALLQIKGDPDLLRALDLILKDLDKVQAKPIQLQVQIDRDAAARSVADAQTVLQAAQAKLSSSLSANRAAPIGAVAQAEDDFSRFKLTVEDAIAELDQLAQTKGIPDEVIASVQALSSELDRGIKLPNNFTIGLASSIASEVENARQILDTRLADILRRANEGFIFQGQATAEAGRELDKFRNFVDEARDAIERLKQTNPELASQLEDVAVRIKTAREGAAKPLDTNEEGGFFTGLQAGINTSVDSLTNLRNTGVSVGAALVNGFGDFIDLLIQGGQSIGQFARQYIAAILAMIAKTFALKAAQSALGLFGIPIGTAAAAMEGGAVSEFHRGDPDLFLRAFPHALRFGGGGSVPMTPGSRRGVDSVPALLNPEEFVFDVPSSKYYGGAIMRMMLERRIPRDFFRLIMGNKIAPLASVVGARHAAGGPIGSTNTGGRRGGDQSFSPAILFSDQQQLQTFLNGGAPELFRHVENNQAKWRRALGMS